MKKLLLSATFVLMFPTVALSASFLPTVWGMSKSAVLASQDIPLTLFEPQTEGVEDLRGETVVGERPCFIFFTFVDDQLVRIRFTFQTVSGDKTAYLPEYRRIGDRIRQKYGREINKEEYFRFEDDQEYSLSSGQGYLTTEWKVSVDSYVKHFLHGDTKGRARVHHYIDYASYEGIKKMKKILKERDKFRIILSFQP